MELYVCVIYVYMCMHAHMHIYVSHVCMYVCTHMCMDVWMYACTVELRLDHLDPMLFPPLCSRTLNVRGSHCSVLGPLLCSIYAFFFGDCIQSHEFKYHTHADSSQIYNSALTCLLESSFVSSTPAYSTFLPGCLIDISNYHV